MNILEWDIVLEQCFLLMYHVPGSTWESLQGMPTKIRNWMFMRLNKQLERENKLIKSGGK